MMVHKLFLFFLALAIVATTAAFYGLVYRELMVHTWSWTLATGSLSAVLLIK